MEKLKEWKLEQNTLVIFMTDNGHSIAKLYNAGMRGAKGTAYEGGTRVPSFWRWPGVFKAGVDVDKLTAHIDLFATFAQLAGAKIPDNLQLDGRSLLPLLQDPNAPWPDRYFFTHVGRWPKGEDPDKWKFRGCSVRNARYSLVNNRELYDLQNDPGQSQNVIDQHPDAVAALRAAYEKWWTEVRPCMENENAVGPEVNPFKALYWKQFGR
jgi:arylsulfatase